MLSLELKEPIPQPIDSVMTAIQDWSKKLVNEIEVNQIVQVRPSENVDLYLTNRKILLRVKLLKIFKDGTKTRLFIESIFSLVTESTPIKSAIARNHEKYPLDRMIERPTAMARRSTKSLSRSSSQKSTSRKVMSRLHNSLPTSKDLKELSKNKKIDFGHSRKSKKIDECLPKSIQLVRVKISDIKDLDVGDEVYLPVSWV